MTHELAREIRTSLPGDLAQAAKITRDVAVFLEKNGVAPRAKYAVQLVLEELITNIINHAHDDGEVHDIDVRVALESGQAIVEIEDDGRPFDPAAAPDADISSPIQDRPIGGLGLHLVRQTAGRMSYARTGGKNRVEVRIPI